MSNKMKKGGDLDSKRRADIDTKLLPIIMKELLDSIRKSPEHRVSFQEFDSKIEAICKRNNSQKIYCEDILNELEVLRSKFSL